MSVLVTIALIATGFASRYDPGVFRTVERNRGMAPFHGPHIALLDCARVGDMVMVCPESEDGRCFKAQVTDCAGIADGGRQWMISGGYAGELDYRTATRGQGLVGAVISVYEVATIEGDHVPR